MHRKILTILLWLLISVSPALFASEYVIDTRGSHAFIQFRIPHLGYSWLLGRFNTFEGRFSYNQQAPEKAWIYVTIDTGSIDTNHAERDKHLRGKDFLDVDRHPQASFVSSAYQTDEAGKNLLHGKLSLRGVTRPITLEVREIGAGMDPWGGYRQGFEGTTKLRLQDYGIDYDLGPASREVHLDLYLEGIREKSEQRRRKR